MHNPIAGRRLFRGTLALAGLGAALSIFVACGGSNAKPAPTPAGKAPASTAATGGSANGTKLNLPGLSADKVQAGIKKAQQARTSAQNSQTTQSVDENQGVRSVAAADSEILGTWRRVTGNLLNGQLSSDEDVTATFNTDGSWSVQSASVHGTGTYRSLGGHEYAVYDSADQAGVYIVGNYLFMANKSGVVIFTR